MSAKENFLGNWYKTVANGGTDGGSKDYPRQSGRPDFEFLGIWMF